MAQFDLKNALIYLQDGYSEAGAINNGAGYAEDATTIVVDGIVGAVPVGNLFVIAGDTTEYTVVSTVESSGNTTSITFTPGLAAAVLDNAVVTIGPRTLRVKIGEGNLTFSEKRAVEYIKDRGKIDEVRLGDEEPMEVKLDMQWQNLTGSDPNSAPPEPEDVLKRRGAAADWVSSDPDACRPYAVDIVLVYAPLCPSIKGEKIVLADYRYEMIDHDTKAGTISTSGKCNILQALVARFAQS